MDDKTIAILGKLMASSYALLESAHKLQTPESLPVPATSSNVVEEARKTLRFLRNLQNLSLDMEGWLNIGNISEQQYKLEWLEKLIEIYSGQVKITQLSNPDLLKHFTVDYANHAVGSIAVSVTLHTIENLPEDSEPAALLDSQLDDILPEWESRQSQSVEELIDSIESALTHLLNKPLSDRSPVDRLVEVSNIIQNAVRQLYSIDTLKEPAREESIELAREILRRLKNMAFSDKNIEDAIDTGKPNEKLAFAKRIAEMINIYKNMLSEAVRTNPNIINDIRVKNANDAAGNCSEAIKLMATKEIPSNSSSLQQISADIEQIKNKSLNHLMHKMEGGVEKAQEEIDAQKKHEQKEHSEAQHASEQSEKLRRRRRQQKAVAVNKSAHKAYSAVQHEKVLSLLRGDHKTIAALKQLDMDAIRKAGSSIRNSNRQANEMMASNKKLADAAKTIGSGANVSVTSPLKPDDKGFAERERDLNNPNNPNHPRNRPRIV